MPRAPSVRECDAQCFTTIILMYFLVVSKTFMAGKLESKKTPGIALADELQRRDIFKLLDLPSNFNGLGPLESFKILYRATKKLLKYSIAHRRGEFFFYNLPKAYIYYYFLIKIFGGRTSLFLADGENCIGLKLFPRLFNKLFERIVHLNYLNKNYYKITGKSEYWFPGILDKRVVANFQVTSSNLRTILYNSSLKAANNPHLLVEVADANPEVQFYCTSDINDFLNYGVVSLPYAPGNITFLSELSQDDYKNLLQKVDGILLIRDEKRFENMFNFPSKLLEALSCGKTVFSIYEISGVPSHLYVNCKESLDLNSSLRTRMEGSMGVDYHHFVEACDVQNLIAWLNGKNTRNGI